MFSVWNEQRHNRNCAHEHICYRQYKFDSSSQAFMRHFRCKEGTCNFDLPLFVVSVISELQFDNRVNVTKMCFPSENMRFCEI